MTTAPTLNGQVIGQAAIATRAVLDGLLAETGVAFNDWVAVNLLGTTGELAPVALVQQLATGLRIDEASARSVVASVRRGGLLEGTSTLTLTGSGSVHFARITAGIAAVTERLYGDIPVDDLVVARRVLETVTSRARAELDARPPAATRVEAE